MSTDDTDVCAKNKKVKKTEGYDVVSKNLQILETMNRKRLIIERLYLDRDKNGQTNKIVFVENSHLLPQHQKDGIRFLYSQFKETNPGVILNDPSGYGKRLQIVLFINAIRHVVTQPVVIFCKDVNVQNWIEHFQKWTDLSEEIATEARNHLVKKFVFINTLETWNTIGRGNWSLMIVDNDEIKPKTIGKVRTHYKIWVTSINMKMNRDKFGEVFKWLHSCDFEFENIYNNTNCTLTKAIQFESKINNIVLRRDKWKGPLFGKNTVVDIQIRRNGTKDVTGTKIKRTRKTADQTRILPPKIARNNGNADVSMSTSDFRNENELDFTSISEREVKIDSVMDIENFVRDENPISEGFEHRDTEVLTKNQRQEEVNSHSPINGTEKTAGNKIEKNNAVLDDTKNNIIIDKFEVDDSAVICPMQVDSGVSQECATNKGESDNSIETNNICTNTKVKENPCNIMDVEKERKCNNISIIDSKVSDLEKEAIKKFKGSILDRLF